MTIRYHVARILVSSFLMAIFVVFFVKPTITISPVSYIVVVVSAEIVAAVIAATLSNRGAVRKGFQTLALAFIFSAILLLLFKPASANFEDLFIGVFIVQIIGLSIATIGTRNTQV
jgi:CHASE2 domain-containing sensor protein